MMVVPAICGQRAVLGQTREGFALYHQGTLFSAGGIALSRCSGRGCHKAGEVRQALDLLDEVLDRVERTGKRWFETLNPRETAHVQVSIDFPGSPTDHAIVAVYTTLDDTSEVFDLIPMMEFLIENTTDPNRISFLVTGVYKFRVGVRRSGSTDTITSADLSLRKDGVNA